MTRPTGTMDTRGSRPRVTESPHAPNMPSMRNSPWAKLIISIRPQMMVSPTATPRRSARGLRLAVPLLPARHRVDDLEVRALREVPGPDGVLLAVPPDLGYHARGQVVLVVLVELDSLVVDDELGRRHVRLVGGLGERRRLHRLRAIDGVGHPQQPGDLAHGE